MSRQLNAEQKRLLDNAFEKGITCAEDLSYWAMIELEKMNDHETLWQNVDRYLLDKLFEEVYDA